MVDDEVVVGLGRNAGQDGGKEKDTSGQNSDGGLSPSREEGRGTIGRELSVR